jgi:hypothetical protein
MINAILTARMRSLMRAGIDLAAPGLELAMYYCRIPTSQRRRTARYSVVDIVFPPYHVVYVSIIVQT